MTPPPDPERLQQRKQTMKRLFFILIAIGLVGGALLSVGIIQLMTRFGLTERPQPEQFQNAIPAIAPENERATAAPA